MVYKHISSPANETVKYVKKLQARRSFREENGRFVIEGERAVLDAVRAGAYLEAVIIQKSYKGPSVPQGVARSFYSVDDRLFAEMSATQAPQGIMAVAVTPRCDAREILKKRNPLLLICDELSDPGNLGTIIRTADAAGADGVFLSKGCVDPFNPKTVRSTMASLFNVPMVTGASATDYLELAREAGVMIAAGDPHGGIYHYQADFTGPTAIVIGNEAHGVGGEVLKSADVRVKIPLLGKAESLNAAVAASILMYEAVRQRLSER